MPATIARGEPWSRVMSWLVASRPQEMAEMRGQEKEGVILTAGNLSVGNLSVERALLTAGNLRSNEHTMLGCRQPMQQVNFPISRGGFKT